MIPPIVLVGVMAVIFTVFMAVGQGMYYAYLARQEREAKELLRRLNMINDTMAESLFRERARDAAAQALGNLGVHLQGVIEAADSQMLVSTLLVQISMAGLVGAVIGFILMPPIGIMLGPVAAMIPYLLLRRTASVRAQKLVEQLPEALDLMARSLQAGLGLNEAFRTCAEEMPLPVASEFGRVFEEVRFGREYREALTNLTKRNPGVFDLRLFVSSVLLQRETGGNLIEILDSISNTIRGRFLFLAKVRAMTSEARFSAMILGGLPIVVGSFVTFINPKYINALFSGDPLGYFFVGYFFCSYCVGGFLMYTVSQVEV
jgi:tight adherence protein B